MSYKLLIFDTPEKVAQEFAGQLVQIATDDLSQIKHVCLSGGSTPKRMFEILASDYAKTNWSSVHFYWGDERCVLPTDDQSNFGVANKLFFENANIPESNIHRILGEIDPEQASRQYSAELKQHVTAGENVPIFDLMILGMGDDGHTASIFPHQMELVESEKLCEVATHPDSGQQRVTITGQVIRAARRICFLVSGQNKADVLAQILNQTADAAMYPTTQFINASDVTFFLDSAAASKLQP